MKQTSPITANDIIEFWYSAPMNQHWFASTPDIDQEILTRFAVLWQQAKSGELDVWKQTAQGCLALIIVLDQFPLNMFRNQAKSFATEAQAIEVTLYAISQGFDLQIDKAKLGFLLMPLMHSENLEHQNLSLKLFQQHDLQSHIRFAKHHRDLVKKFGRFPHRNDLLGRPSTPEEVAYLQSDKAFKG